MAVADGYYGMRQSYVGRVSVFCVTRQALRSNTRYFLIECLAHPAGYGTNNVPNPPYIDLSYFSSG